MLQSSLASLNERLGAEDVVLDVGGWGRPLARADWVIDLMPYESRGLYGRDGEENQERFSAETWVQADLCAREPYPFADDQFDFVVCSHTLEDLRDPVWVCSELTRIGKAGYIEVPSRLEEQSYGVQGPWVGWGHHHWLIEIGDNRLEFVFKPHILPREGAHFPPGFHELLSPEERVLTFWWENSFEVVERIFYDPVAMDAWLEDFVAEGLRKRAVRPSRPHGLLARARRATR